MIKEKFPSKKKFVKPIFRAALVTTKQFKCDG